MPDDARRTIPARRGLMRGPVAVGLVAETIAGSSARAGTDGGVVLDTSRPPRRGFGHTGGGVNSAFRASADFFDVMGSCSSAGGGVGWRVLLVIAIVSLISPLTACSSTSSSPVGEAFAARATAVCQRALASKQAWSRFPVASFDPAHPDPSAFPKAAVWLEKQVAPTFDTWLNGLRALGPPPKARKAWSDVLAAVATIVQGNADEIAAAKAGDTEGFVAARNRLIETQTKLVQATAAAGVPTCADVHKE